MSYDFHDGFWRVLDERGNVIAQLINNKAEARLFSATPDLLKELEHAVKLLRLLKRHLPAWNEGDEADVSSMEWAIEKATKSLSK